MDRPFDQPLRLGNGTRTVSIGSVMEAAALLMKDWPPKKRRLASYRVALQACVLGLAGRAEPETVRQALLAAVMDAAKKSAVKSGPQEGAREPSRLNKRAVRA